MIANLDGSSFELPDHDDFAQAADALECDERTADVIVDDPMAWIGLYAAVGNWLYQPGDFTREQLVGHFQAITQSVLDLLGEEES